MNIIAFSENNIKDTSQKYDLLKSIKGTPFLLIFVSVPFRCGSIAAPSSKGKG